MKNKSIVFALFLTLIAQKISAQSDYFYRLCPELDTVQSNGYGLHYDSSGYFLLYSSLNDTNQWVWGSSIARYDNSNNLLWKQNYSASSAGNIIRSKLLVTADSQFVFCGDTFDSIGKGFFVKTDYSGNPTFIRTYGGNYRYFFSQIIETSDSGLMIVGSTDSLATNSNFPYNLFVMKTDEMGNRIWDTVIKYNSCYSTGSSICSINNKIYIVTAHSYSTSYAFNRGALICITEDGQIVMNKTISPGFYGGFLFSINPTSQGTLMIGGSADDYYWPNDGSLFGESGYGYCFIGEYDTLGNAIWTKKYFVPNFVQRVMSIKEVSGGYIACGGTGWDWFYSEDSLYSAPSYSIEDVFIMKITEIGDSLWMRLFRKQDGRYNRNKDWADQDIVSQNMEIYPNGDILLTGQFFPISSVSQDWLPYAWVLKTDSNGCGKPGLPYGLWREELPYNADSSIVHLTWQDDDTTNIWHHVQGSKDGQWYFWELTPRMLTTKEFFDTVPKYHNYCYRVFGLDSTWARTCESTEICITTGINEYATETGLLAVYPNPANDIINCVLPDNVEYDLFVFDALGSIVYPSAEFIQRNAGLRITTEVNVVQLNISNLPPGIYFIEACGENILRGKFVKE